MTAPLPDSLLDEVHRLTLASLGGEAKPKDIERLEEILITSDVARKVYARAIRDSMSLRRWAEAEQLHDGETFSSDAWNTEAFHLGLSDANLADFIAALPSPEALPRGDSRAAPSFVGYLNDGWHGVGSYLGSGDLLKSYLAATLLFAIGLLIGLAWRISLTSPTGPIPYSTDLANAKVVGQITALADCQWSKQGSGVRGPGSLRPKTEDRRPKTVFLGDCFTLSSGLMEITYDTGAKVILQGPCTYEIDSNRGGYLAVGKLTARVEKGSEVKGPGSGATPPSAFSLQPSALFAVRTPTATVTDLGTEFGVEVEKSGATYSHVFQGKVELRENSRRLTTSGAIVEILHAGQSARVKRGRNNKVAITREPGQSDRFVRRISKSSNLQISKSPSASFIPHPSSFAYRLTDLGTLGGRNSCAVAFNEIGHVVGWAETPSGAKHAFFYADGKMTDLGVLEGGESCAYGVNLQGEVVGCSGFPFNEMEGKAFLYADGEMVDLGSLGRKGACAYDINNAGQIVGAAHASNGIARAFLYTRETGMKDLNAPGDPKARSRAERINAYGHAVGRMTMRGRRSCAFLWTPDAGMKNLGSLDGRDAWAMDVNEAGSVVGLARSANNDLHAFLYREGMGMKDLSNLLPGRVLAAVAVNNAGDVVFGVEGPPTPDGSFMGRALLIRNGERLVINSLIDHADGWQVFYATGINDSGQIIGKGKAPDGGIRAVLLTPTKGHGARD